MHTGRQGGEASRLTSRLASTRVDYAPRQPPGSGVHSKVPTSPGFGGLLEVPTSPGSGGHLEVPTSAGSMVVVVSLDTQSSHGYFVGEMFFTTFSFNNGATVVQHLPQT